MATYCFDLDGTLCSTSESDYSNATPRLERIVKVNELASNGHKVIIFTARGGSSGLDWTELTKKQLREWGVIHHALILGKPAADYYIDDKAVKDEDFFRVQSESEHF